MNKKEKLSIAWAKYRFRIEQFELEKEKELIQKNPELSNEKIAKKLYIAVEQHFKEESNCLLQNHLIITDPFRKI